MVQGYESIQATDGERVAAADARNVLAGAELIYDDGAVQRFSVDGTTVYVESGRETDGSWSVEDDGSFSSYWPPSFHARYDLKWRVEERVVGLSFESQRDNSVFSGRFRTPTK